MRKLLLSLMLLCATCAAAWAQEMTHVLVVELKDGNATKFSLLNEPNISVKDTQINISFLNSEDESAEGSFTCGIDMFRKFYFIEEEATAIDDIKEDTPKANVTYNDDHSVTISGLESADKVSLYSIDGRKVADINAAGGQAQISLDGLADGIYVASINNKQSFKIVKR